MKNKKGSRRSRNKGTADAASGGGGRPSKLCLGKLPDDVLLNIMERLDTFDAMRTCILSKRMMKIPAMLSRFDIDVASLVHHHDEASHGYNIRHEVRYNDAVAGVTEKILDMRNRDIPIRKLRIRFYLRRYECLSVSKAVARTMATQKVHDAEFAFLTEKAMGNCTDADLLCYAKQFKTCLGDCPAAFAGLTRLWLRNMRFDEPDIPNILRTCKQLESLRLSCCDAGFRSVLQLENDGLVELHIDYGKFAAVELICLPNLQRVSYNIWSFRNPLFFGSVPKLSMLSLTNMGISSTKNVVLSHLLANVPYISDLHMDFKSEKIWVLPEHPEVLAPVLGELQVVNLDNLPEGCDIAWTMFILEAAPSLKELTITVWDHLCDMVADEDFRRKHGYCEKTSVEWQPSDHDFKHKNLVKLTIYGFQPDQNFTRYIRRVMEVAMNIEEISLHDRKVCKRCGKLDPKIKIKVSPSRYPRTSVEKDMLRDEITKEIGIASTAVINFRS